MNFDEIPTKQVTVIDWDALIARLLQGPMQLSGNYPMMDRGLYVGLAKRGYVLAYKTRYVMQLDGTELPVCRLTMKEKK